MYKWNFVSISGGDSWIIYEVNNYLYVLYDEIRKITNENCLSHSSLLFSLDKLFKYYFIQLWWFDELFGMKNDDLTTSISRTCNMHLILHFENENVINDGNIHVKFALF